MAAKAGQGAKYIAYFQSFTNTYGAPAHLRRLFQTAIEPEDVAILSIATRPDCLGPEILELLAELNRVKPVWVELGLQTIHPASAAYIRRGYDLPVFDAAVKQLKAIGVRAVVHQILGLPGELEADVQRTIEKIVELAPDSLTVHSLAIKRASRLNQWIQENGVSMLHNTDETMKIAAAGAEKLGMKPYYLYRQKNMSGNFENTGYARPGKYGLYNILIMEEKQTIVALGAGSITKRVFPDGRIERCDNVKDVGLYIEKIDEMIERKKELFAE